MTSSLEQLREALRTASVDAFVVGSGDAHQSEYVHESDMRRSYISNFTGSAGTALVCLDQALLWTDGRYFLQASTELSQEWTLMKSGEPGVLELNDWITTSFSGVIGVDPSLISATQAKTMQKAFDSKGIILKTIEPNPVDQIWVNRPARPQGSITCHNAARSGKSHEEKIVQVQTGLSKGSYDAVVISMLDEVAWLFNIRGSDVSFNPVVIAYGVVTKDSAHLFVEAEKLSDEVRGHLTGVVIHDYQEIEAFLVELSANSRILVDPGQLNWKLYRAIGDSAVDGTSLIALPKSLKNDTELTGIRQCHLRDGAALTAFLGWLESAVRAEPNTISEFDVTEKLEEFRGKLSGHVSPSFSTIAGYGPNGAIIHYKPEKATAATLGLDSLFLLDSGGQYLDGTTDVTRTIHFGVPTERMKTCFTLVLRGHIALARAVFPEGTAGSRLDTLARLPLWQAGLDYNHGTGHGVGAFLNVHEGPQGIGFRPRPNEAGFQPGMTSSNEPGYYEEGAFGIRIENVCITVPSATPNNFAGRRFCEFETVTMTPIKTSLVDAAMLDDVELKWLNDYNATVRTALQPLMEAQFPEAVGYLLQETEPLLR